MDARTHRPVPLPERLRTTIQEAPLREAPLPP